MNVTYLLAESDLGTETFLNSVIHHSNGFRPKDDKGQYDVARSS